MKCNLGCFPCGPNCYLRWSPGVWLMDALRRLSQMAAWRTTWLEFTSTRRNAIEYNNPLFSCLPFGICCSWLGCFYSYCFLSVWPSGLWKGLQQEEQTESPSVWAPTASAISVSGYTSNAEKLIFFFNLCFLSGHLKSNFWCSCTFSGCAKEFPSQGKLKHHERMHAGWLMTTRLWCLSWHATKKKKKNPHLSAAGYPCENAECPFKGKTWTEYLEHRKEHKGNAGWCFVALHILLLMSLDSMTLFSVKVPCGTCKKLFYNTWFLRQHELHVHSGEKRVLSCPRKGCNKKFTRRFNLESHVQGDHEGKKPFSCAYAGCGKSFAMKVNLNNF